MPDQAPAPTRSHLEDERWALLAHVDALLDAPLTALAFVWLGLLILDFTTGLNALGTMIGNLIWALFILDFVIEIVIAPRKLEYLRRNWLTAIALLVPALRVLRIFRAFRLLRAVRAVRSLSLVRLLTSLNRGAGAVRQTLGRRGVGYVVALTLIVTFAGAAAMALFESPAALREEGLLAPGETDGLNGYADALWWTAMLVTTLGSQYWPKTVEGRILTFLLAVYAFAVFGYITATLASYFVGQDATAQSRTPAGETSPGETAALRHEIAMLRQELAAWHSQPAPPPGAGDPLAAANPATDGERLARRTAAPR